MERGHAYYRTWQRAAVKPVRALVIKGPAFRSADLEELEDAPAVEAQSCGTRIVADAPTAISEDPPSNAPPPSGSVASLKARLVELMAEEHDEVQPRAHAKTSTAGAARRAAQEVERSRQSPALQELSERTAAATNAAQAARTEAEAEAKAAYERMVALSPALQEASASSQRERAEAERLAGAWMELEDLHSQAQALPSRIAQAACATEPMVRKARVVSAWAVLAEPLLARSRVLTWSAIVDELADDVAHVGGCRRDFCVGPAAWVPHALSREAPGD
mmetsp:Transcript_32602/g.95419  ORF Transcript_32602/g.95419 Transcript_32602/m.95419 type:complete len:277 (-) Transcript_32602:132-962(-)|eukprot:CAMPEP_0170250546 /NCGR_PEP_ID=MMETSP0116_2-20130129/25089_1 /TAXON_ID=400756 /ORGANISM="Durinskia baltica, Strain CSIRO CS-38" /LENGTH=276 /DNA_ID=CAMNT_0010501481 /DNA_START=105 /DNA_END=935 /DNA_ORIENTATION=-